jgi:flagellar biosynthesis/type III secretory pathway protein FliH
MGMKVDQVPQETTLEEYQSMLAERMDEWNRQMLQRGVEQGVQQGMQQGMQQGIRTGESRALLRLLEKRFGAVEQAVRDRIEAADSEVLLDWIERASTAAALDDVFS